MGCTRSLWTVGSFTPLPRLAHFPPAMVLQAQEVPARGHDALGTWLMYKGVPLGASGLSLCPGGGVGGHPPGTWHRPSPTMGEGWRRKIPPAPQTDNPCQGQSGPRSKPLFYHVLCRLSKPGPCPDSRQAVERRRGSGRSSTLRRGVRGGCRMPEQPQGCSISHQSSPSGRHEASFLFLLLEPRSQ